MNELQMKAKTTLEIHEQMV